MTISRKKKRSPKRVMALPDLEQSKTAVLKSLRSKSGQRSRDHAITDLWSGTASSLAWRSIAPWSCDTGSISNRNSMRRQRSINAWRPFGGSPLRPPIPGCSVQNCQPESDASKESTGWESVSGTDSR